MAKCTYRICYVCREKKPPSKFRKSEFICNDCIPLGVVVPKKIEIRACAECGTEFSTVPSQDKKFCSNECYHEYLLSDKNPRRGVPLKQKKPAVAPIASSKSNELEVHKERCTTTLKTFGEITKLCSKLHISYGQYQQYKESGELDQMIKKLDDSLF